VSAAAGSDHTMNGISFSPQDAPIGMHTMYSKVDASAFSGFNNLFFNLFAHFINHFLNTGRVNTPSVTSW
jgi:hypothetical protein